VSKLNNTLINLRCNFLNINSSADNFKFDLMKKINKREYPNITENFVKYLIQRYYEDIVRLHNRLTNTPQNGSIL
jgi:hypothetical protein